MKKRDRVLGALSAVVFGLLVFVIVVAFFAYFGKELKYGIGFVDALKLIPTLFDFSQTTFYVITQYLTLATFLIGIVWACIWLILGCCKKHLIEILFFFGILVAFFFFGLVMMLHGETFFRYINESAEIKGDELGRLLILPVACLLVLAGIIVVFAYDMKRIFAKDVPIIIVEPDEYKEENLFAEMFEGKKAPKVEVAPTQDDERVKAIMEKVELMILEEKMYESRVLSEEDIPAILKQKEVVVEETKEEFYERPAILDMPLKEEKEEVYERLAILDMPDKEEELEIPDFFKTESELAREREAVAPVVEEAPAVVVEQPVHRSGKAYHISHVENGYQVKAAGGKEPEGVFATEDDAVLYVRQSFPEAPIRVHDSNGKIHSL